MPEYLVSWQIELYADTAVEAAEKALRIHRDPASIATVFEVTGPVGMTTTVDLDDQGAQVLDEQIECAQDFDGTCTGAVEYRMSLSGSGVSYARCDKHWAERLDREQQLRDRYPIHAPSDWSPSDAGEAWGEDDY